LFILPTALAAECLLLKGVQCVFPEIDGIDFLASAFDQSRLIFLTTKLLFHLLMRADITSSRLFVAHSVCQNIV
jgi:hypothetical protein